MGPVVACEKDEDSAADGGDDNGGRTLLDIILQENEINGAVEDGNSSSSAAWKTLRDHFRLHSDDASSLFHLLSIPSTEPVALSHPIPVAVSLSELADPEPTDVVASAATSEPTTSPEARTASEGGSEVINAGEDSNCNPISATESLASAAAPGEEEVVEEPARVSLMALLEQTDRQWGGSGREGLSPVAEDEEAAVSGRGAMSCVCCVCMVRHKGAAFIPCGHTFCRVCSHELCFGRGSCPLCNRQILEILDIF